MSMSRKTTIKHPSFECMEAVSQKITYYNTHTWRERQTDTHASMHTHVHVLHMWKITYYNTHTHGERETDRHTCFNACTCTAYVGYAVI